MHPCQHSRRSLILPGLFATQHVFWNVKQRKFADTRAGIIISLLCKQVCDMFDVSQSTGVNMHVTQGHFADYHVRSCVSQAERKEKNRKDYAFQQSSQEPPEAAARTTKPTDCMNCVYLLSGSLDTNAMTSHNLICCAELQSEDGSKHLLTLHMSLKLRQQLQRSHCGGSCHSCPLSSQACTHTCDCHWDCCRSHGHGQLRAV